MLSKEALKISKLDRKLNCDECDYKTKSKTHLGLHFSKRHEGVVYACNLCTFNTSYIFNLDEHKIGVHSPKSINCGKCTYTTSNKRALKKHTINIHAEKKVKCLKCEFTTGNNTSLKRHMKGVHSRDNAITNIRDNFQCVECNATFNSMKSLRIHFSITHDRKIKDLNFPKFLCNHCELIYSTKGGLQKHVKSKHLGLIFSCIVCNFKHDDKHTLNIHMKMVHNKGNLTIFQCDDCKFKTAKNVNLLITKDCNIASNP